MADTIDTIYTMDTIDTAYKYVTIDTVDTIDMVDAINIIATKDTIEAADTIHSEHIHTIDTVDELVMIVITIAMCVAAVQDQNQVAEVKTKLLKPKLWKAEIRPDRELTTNTACSRSRRPCAKMRVLIPPLLRWKIPRNIERRRRRRANKKRNLLKGLEPLSEAETEVVVPAAKTVQAQPIGQDPTILEEEGKQEEDDPTENHRWFAAAYAAGLRQAPPETEPQVTHPSSADRAATKRARSAEQQRIRRANLTAWQTERRRAKDKERQRARRARLTDSQRAGVRDADLTRVQQRRAEQSTTDRTATNAVNHEQYSSRRSEQSEADRDIGRERSRVRRKAPKKCQGHVNHEGFRASMVKVKDVVDGRHRLPPTTI
ncbi:unnamed protein product [Phytophthora fragariaefolia]|uniref:Unnamed protein product n=1 Tax=Phytophthora fragariaefolia TaxID=1490495 RepID=A0A9W6UD40_9STRA|nr:unnamed protein product [Phytophthora fragariaefolia]